MEGQMIGFLFLSYSLTLWIYLVHQSAFLNTASCDGLSMMSALQELPNKDLVQSLAVLLLVLSSFRALLGASCDTDLGDRNWEADLQ